MGNNATKLKVYDDAELAFNIHGDAAIMKHIGKIRDFATDQRIKGFTEGYAQAMEAAANMVERGADDIDDPAHYHAKLMRDEAEMVRANGKQEVRT